MRADAAPAKTELEKTFKGYCESLVLTKFGQAYTKDPIVLDWMFFVNYPKWPTRSREFVLPISLGWRPKQGQIYIGSTYEIPLEV